MPILQISQSLFYKEILRVWVCLRITIVYGVYPVLLEGEEVSEMEYRRGWTWIGSMASVDIEADMFWNISLSSVPVSEFLLWAHTYLGLGFFPRACVEGIRVILHGILCATREHRKKFWPREIWDTKESPDPQSARRSCRSTINAVRSCANEASTRVPVGDFVKNRALWFSDKITQWLSKWEQKLLTE